MEKRSSNSHLLSPSPTNILCDVENLENVCWKRRGRCHIAATVKESCAESVFQLSSRVTKLQVFHSFSSHLVHYVIHVGKPMQGLCGKCLICNSVKKKKKNKNKKQCGTTVVKKELVSQNWKSLKPRAGRIGKALYTHLKDTNTWGNNLSPNVWSH